MNFINSPYYPLSLKYPTNFLNLYIDFFLKYDSRFYDKTKIDYNMIDYATFICYMRKYPKYMIYYNILNYKHHSFLYLSDNCMNNFINMFFKLQKIYYNLKRFIKIIISKKCKLKNNTNLLLDPIDIENETNLIITNFKTRSKYIFTINCLIHLSTKNLIYCDSYFDFYVKGLVNPYTNKNFDNGSSFLIYNFLIKHKKCPTILKIYYDSYFDNDLFLKKNRSYIYDICIKNVYEQSYKKNNKMKLKILNSMLQKFYPITIVDIKEFNTKTKEKLITLLSPFIITYLQYLYKDDPYETSYYKNKIVDFFNLMYENNKQFGKKVIKYNRLFKKNTIYINQEIFFNNIAF